MKKIINFISWLFITLSFVILIYTIIKLRIYDLKNLNDFQIKYFIFFSLIFTCSIIIYFQNIEIKTRFFVISSSILFSLFILEGTLTYIDYTNSVKYHAKINDDNFDERSRYEYYLDLKKEYNDITISMPPFIIHRDYIKSPKKYKLLPLAGISDRKTIFCNEAGFFVTYESDRYGFNNQDVDWNKKKHLLFLGDSYLQGVCVKQNFNITGQIKKKINSEEYGLINLGQRGNGPLSEYASLKEYSKVLNPIKIFWLYYEGNDLKNLRYENNIEFLKKYLDDNNYSQNLANNQKIIDKYLDNIFDDRLKFEKNTSHYLKENKFLVFLKLKKLRDKFKKISFKNEKIDFENEIKQFRKILGNSIKISDDLGADFYFVYIPSFSRIDNTKINDNDLFEYGKIKTIVKTLNIKMIDLNELLIKNSSNPKNYYPYGLPKHFNEAGYLRISEIILDNANIN